MEIRTPNSQPGTEMRREAHLRKARATKLILLNGVLLAALGAVSVWPAVSNAFPQPGRARGDYTMVSGKPNAGNNNVVYIIDAANQEMVVLRYDSTNRRYTPQSYRSLDTDSKVQPGR
jgi:hypothetical protein